MNISFLFRLASTVSSYPTVWQIRRATLISTLTLVALSSAYHAAAAEAAPRHSTSIHRSKKLKKRRTKKHAAAKTARFTSPPLPRQVITTGLSPLPMNAIPPRPIAVFHPDKAPGGTPPEPDATRAAPDTSRTRVIHVPSPDAAQQPAN